VLASESALVLANRLAFEREPITVSDDLKNQINYRWPGGFIEFNQLLVAEMIRPL